MSPSWQQHAAAGKAGLHCVKEEGPACSANDSRLTQLLSPATARCALGRRASSVSRKAGPACSAGVSRLIMSVSPAAVRCRWGGGAAVRQGRRTCLLCRYLGLSTFMSPAAARCRWGGGAAVCQGRRTCLLCLYIKAHALRGFVAPAAARCRQGGGPAVRQGRRPACSVDNSRLMWSMFLSSSALPLGRRGSRASREKACRRARLEEACSEATACATRCASLLV